MKMLKWFSALLLLVGAQASAQVPNLDNINNDSGFGGSKVCTSATINNTGSPGYGPYLRLHVPQGLTLSSASLFTSNVPPTVVGTFPAAPNNTLLDPITNETITGTAGEQLITLQPPIGSVVTNGIPLAVEVCFAIDSAASINIPLTVMATPVYQFGDTPTGINGAVVGASKTFAVTPTLVTFSKANTALEGERPPGMSWPTQYTLTANIADNKTLTAINLSDTLPAAFVLDPASVTVAPASCHANTAGNPVTINCGSITGSGSADVVVSYTGYYSDVLNENACHIDVAVNSAMFDANFSGSPITQEVASNRVSVEHLTLQKSVSATTGIPGDSVTFTLAAQLSDYATANSVVITDVLPNGLTFTGNETITITTNMGVTNIVAAVNNNTPTAGQTTLVFDVTALPAVSDIAAGSAIQITYDAVIDQGYAGASDVLASDSLTNTASVAYNLAAGANACTNTTSANIDILPVTVEKSVVAGVGPYLPGQTVTYLLRADIPSGDTRDLVFTDYFPLPVFDISSTTFTLGANVRLAAVDTLGLTPVMSVDTATNSLRIAWPDVNTTAPQVVAVEVDVIVADTPFADNLSLSNLMRVSSENTQNTAASAVAPVLIQTRAPELTMTKGVASASQGTISPPSSTAPIDGNLMDVDAGDAVMFTLTVENTGGAPAYDVSVTESIPAGLTSCTVPEVRNNAGLVAAIGYSVINGSDIVINFSNNILPTNAGALAAGDSFFIDVACTVAASVEPNQMLENTASVVWASLIGATTFPAQSDTATITIARPEIAKSLAAISPNATGTTNVTAGDIVTYEMEVTLPEGEVNNLTLTDTLPSGFQYINNSVTVDSTGFAGSTIALGTVAVAGQTVTIPLNRVTTTDDNNTANNAFAVRLQAQVADVAANDGASTPQNKTNTVALDYEGRTGSTMSDTAATNFVTPIAAVNKLRRPAGRVTVGDEITFRFRVRNTGTAPMYNVVVSDILDPDLFDLSTVQNVTTVNQPTAEGWQTYSMTGFDYAYDTTTGVVTFSQQAGQSLAAGTTRNFKIKVQVKAGVVSNSGFSNTVTVVGDSQNGIVSGERQTSNSSSINVLTAIPSVEKNLIGTSEAWTTGSEVAIGEVLTYQVVYTIPEGVTLSRLLPVNQEHLIFQDDLPTGLSYIVGSATYQGIYDTSLTASNLTSASNVTGAIPVTVTPVPSGKMTVTNNNRRLRFFFGDIMNSDADDMASSEQIVLTYQVLVRNNNSNQRSTDKRNSAKLRYRNQAGNNRELRDGVTVAIVEPNLSVAKTAAPNAAGGGDTVNFTVVISNPASVANVTRAWEVVATDNLPAGYAANSLVFSSAVLNRGSGVDISACVTTAGNGWTLTTDDISCSVLAPDQDYLAPDETITIAYSAQVDSQVTFNDTLANTVAVTVTSLPNSNGTANATSGASGSDSGERTGSGSSANDLAASSTATVAILTPSITKTVADNTQQIGEITTATLTVALPIGTSTHFMVKDILPAGLRYTGGDIVITKPSAVSTNVSGANTITVNSNTRTLVDGASPISGIAAVDGNDTSESLVFDFGQLEVTATSALTITYPVQVRNIIGNQRMTALTNSASVSYDGVSTTNPPQAAAAISVIEPNVEVTKAISSGATGSVAGDVITYELIVANTDLAATAYRVNIRDVVPPELLGGLPTTFTAVTLDNAHHVVLTGTTTDVIAANHNITTTTHANDTLSLPLLDMPPNSSLTIRYQVTVASSAAVGASLTNTLSVDYDSLPAGLPNSDDGRNDGDIKDDESNALNNYGETISANVRLDSGIAVQKSLAASAPSQYAIGATVAYDLRIDLLEGTTNAVVISDTLPVGMRFVSVDNGLILDNTNPPNLTHSASAVSATLSGTGTAADPTVATINLGDIVNVPDDASFNNDYAIVRLILRVDNHAGNHNGDTLINTATVNSANAGNANATQAITVVEPIVGATKTASNPTPALGEIVTYTLAVKHQMGSSSTAYDIAIADTLPAGMTFVAGSETGPVAVTSVSPLTFSIASLTLTDSGDGSKTFTYQAKVEETAAVGVGLMNTIAGNYSSLPGNNTHERNGSGTPAHNDYTFTASETITPDTSAVIDATKIVAIAVDNSTAGVADAGDILAYTVTLQNTGTTAVTDVVFTDVIPANTTLVANSLTSSVGTAVEGNPIVVNHIASLAPNATVTVMFQVRINAGTPIGAVIRNQGTVDANETVPEPTDADGVDANGDQPTDIAVGGNPSLTNPLIAEKTVALWQDVNNNGAVNAGDTLRYTIVLNNAGNQPLTAVSLTDTIPTGLTHVPTAVASSGSVSVIGQDLSWTGITSIPAGGFANAVFDVSVDSFTGAAQTFINQANASYTDNGSNKTTQTDSNGNPSDGNQPTTISATAGAGAPALNVQKRVLLAVDNNGDGLASPGDRLAYAVTIINNGSAATQNARFSDVIPSQTSLITGSVTTDYGVVTSGNATPITVNLGSLQPGEVATVRFMVAINAGSGGQTVSNQASVTADNLATSVLSDDNGNHADGLNPTLTPIISSGNSPAVISKMIVNSSEIASVMPTVLLGEVLTYEVAVDMPIGDLAQVTLTDTLPSGLAYIANSARLKRVFSVGLNASANPGGINASSTNDYVSLVDGLALIQNGQALSLSLGDVINSDNATARYVLQYRAVVQNVVSNQEGVDLVNSASLDYLNGLNQPAQLTPAITTVTVAEPAVTVTKTVAPMTLLPSGGTLTYTVVIANTGNAPAYDVAVSDDMPVGWDLQSVNTPIGVIDNSDLTTEQVRLNMMQLANGESRAITYTVVAPAGLNTGGAIDNTASAVWSSLPNSNGTSGETPGLAGSATGERNGDSATNAVNDYAANDTATVSVSAPVLVKTVTNVKTRYAVGDSVSYQLALAVPAGLVMDGTVLTDVLAAGLQYNSGSLTVNADGLTLATQPTDFTNTSNTLTFDVGSLSNPHTTTRTLTLTYSARVENSLANQDGSTLNNTASAAYTDPGTGNAATTLMSNQVITVGEPHLNLLKTLVSPTLNLQAGDTVTYEVRVSNDGSTMAYQTVLADVLPTGLVALNNVQVTAVTPATQAPPILAVATDGLSWASAPFDLAVGSTVTLRLTATLANSVQPQQTIQNRVSANFNSQADALSGGSGYGRHGDGTSNQDDNSVLDNYDASALSPSFTVAGNVQFNKAFYPDSGKTTYTVGETVGYRLTVSLAEGTLANVVVTDELPAGVIFDSATVGFAHSAMQISGSAIQPTMVSGQTLTFDLGDILNPANGDASDDYLTIDIVTRVANIATNQDSVVLGNHARMVYDDASGAPQTLDFDADASTNGVQPLDLTLVEPSVMLSKSVSDSEMSLGDTVTFTLTLAHRADSTADAFNLAVVDSLPVGLTYVPTAAPVPVSVNGQTLTFNVAALTLAQQQTTIRYQARVDNTAVVGQALVNNAALTYAGLANNSGRDGSDGTGGLNDYNGSAQASVTPTVNAALEAQKTVVLGVDSNQNQIVDAGDTLTYTVTLTNTGTEAATHVIFTDPVPVNTTYVTGSVVAAGALSAGESNGVVTVVYDQLPAGGSVVLTFDVMIATGTPIGAVITNQGRVDSDQTVPEATDVDGFDSNGDQPTTIRVGDASNNNAGLSVGKTYRLLSDTVAAIGTNNVGDVVAYDIVVQNTGAVALTDVVLRDTIPTGVTVTNIQSSKGTTTVANTLDLALGTLAMGESVTVTITGILNAVGMMENQASVSSNELPDVLSDSDSDTNNGAQATRFPVLAAGAQGTPQLTLDKTMTLAIDSNADNSINPGELVRVDIVVRNNGSAAAHNVQLRDDLSTLNATLVDYSVTTTQGVVLSRSPLLSVNVGTLAANATATVSFLVNAVSVGAIDNAATANDEAGQNVIASASVPVTAFDPFDPPSGEKVFNAEGIPELAWKQVWINPNDSYFMPVRIVDGIPANSTYVDGSIACEARGISTQSRCEFDAATQQVIFEGSMGADGNATTESGAQNEVVITFRVRVDNLAQQVSNQAEVQWDANGNGSLSDDDGVAVSNDPETDAMQDPTVWKPNPPQAVPSIDRLAMLVLLMLLLRAACR